MDLIDIDIKSLALNYILLYSLYPPFNLPTIKSSTSSNTTNYTDTTTATTNNNDTTDTTTDTTTTAYTTTANTTTTTTSTSSSTHLYISQLNTFIIDSPAAKPIREGKVSNIHRFVNIYGKDGLVLNKNDNNNINKDGNNKKVKLNNNNNNELNNNNKFMKPNKTKEINFIYNTIEFGFTQLLPQLNLLIAKLLLNKEINLLNYLSLIQLDSRLRSRPRFISSCSPIAMPSIADFVLYSICYSATINNDKLYDCWINKSPSTLRWLQTMTGLMNELDIWDSLNLKKLPKWSEPNDKDNTIMSTRKSIIFKNKEEHQFDVYSLKTKNVTSKRGRQKELIELLPNYIPKMTILCPNLIKSENLSSQDIGCNYSLNENITLSPAPLSLLWNSLPIDLDPASGELDINRANRKRLQIENSAFIILKVVTSYFKTFLDSDLANNSFFKFRILEFGCGGGHLGIVVAYLLQTTNWNENLNILRDKHIQVDIKVILMDRKPLSLARAYKRVENLKLSNVELICCDIFDSKLDGFQLGISLHSCGIFTDLILKRCQIQNASFVLVPCCYGSLQCNVMNESSIVSFPKSKLYSNDLQITSEIYNIISSCSDFMQRTALDESDDIVSNIDASALFNPTNKKYMLSEVCMALVDIDRLLFAKEMTSDFIYYYLRFNPADCSPKNKIIVGLPNICNSFNEEFNTYSLF